MKSYTFSEARQKLATLLEEAQREGSVRIQKRNGQAFLLVPELPKKSPLDVEGIDGKGITVEEILSFVREGRKDY
jgi:prevent-host-death family protein